MERLILNVWIENFVQVHWMNFFSRQRGFHQLWNFRARWECIMGWWDRRLESLGTIVAFAPPSESSIPIASYVRRSESLLKTSFGHQIGSSLPSRSFDRRLRSLVKVVFFCHWLGSSIRSPLFSDHKFPRRSDLR